MDKQKPIQVLVFGNGPEAQDLSQLLDDRASMERVRNLEEALGAIADHHVDVVVSAPEDLAALNGSPGLLPQRMHPGGMARAVALIDAQGETVWSSPEFSRLCQGHEDQVRQLALAALIMANDADEGFSLRPSESVELRDDALHLEVLASPVVEPSGRGVAAAVVVSDVSRVRALEDKLNAIDQAGRELVRIDPEQITSLNVHDRLALIEQKVIRFTRDLLHFDHVAVFVLDQRTEKLELALASGMPSEVKAVELYAREEGNGICGYVAKMGRSYLCHDVRNDPHYLLGLREARSSLTVPLRLNDQVVGVFDVESERLGAFTLEDQQFAEIFGRYIAIALHILELLVNERHSTTGQLGRDVMAEIRGPVNDLLTEIETLKEDFIGLDDLRIRLDRLSENVVSLRDRLSEVTQPGLGVVGARNKRIARFDPDLEGRSILIVDDEDLIRETVHDVLAGYGCRVVVAADGDEALESLKHGSFDLVLTDIRLPTRNGYEVFAAAKAVNPATQVILMTGFGYDPNHCIVRANREGLAAVILKPFKVDHLLAEIKSAIKGSSDHLPNAT